MANWLDSFSPKKEPKTIGMDWGPRAATSDNFTDFLPDALQRINTQNAASLGWDPNTFNFDLSNIGIPNADTNMDSSWWKKFIGSKETGPGMATPLMGLLGGGMDFYLGKQGLGLAKDQLKMQKQQFADQFNIQKKQINMDIFDQGQRRYDRRSGTSPTAEEYFEKYRV